MPRRLRHVESIMNPNITIVSPDTTVDEVASLMEAQRVTCVVVVHEGQPLGLVSERDLVNRVVGKSMAPTEVQCSEVMISPAHMIRSDVDLGGAYEQMEELWVRRLVVVDSSDHMVGLVTQADVIAGLYEEVQEIMFENEILHEDALARGKLAEQARIARGVQTQFIPKESPVLDLFDLAGINTQAHEVGGDFFDYIPLGDGSFGVVVGDVVGNGIPAAMLMVMTRSILRSQAIGRSSPAEVLTRCNATFAAERMQGQFVTMYYAIVRKDSREMAVSSAGHLPMMVWRQATGAIELVDCEGLPLGVRPEGGYDEHVVKLDPQDVALIYTDGMVEVRGEHQEFFGMDRLEQVFRQHAGLPVAEVLEQVGGAVEAFAAEDEQLDDRTAVAIRAL